MQERIITVSPLMWLFEPILWLMTCVACYQSGWMPASGISGIIFIFTGISKAGMQQDPGEEADSSMDPVPACEHLWHLRGITITVHGGTVHDYVCGRCGDGFLSESGLGRV